MTASCWNSSATVVLKFVPFLVIIILVEASLFFGQLFHFIAAGRIFALTFFYFQTVAMMRNHGNNVSV